jgi:hypothetical protein
LPNVPQLPGVPALASYVAANVIIAVSDAVIIANTLLAPPWGLYLNGSVVLPTPTSFFGVPIPSVLGNLGNSNLAAIDHKREWTLSDYPVEDGAFESYDKVQLPREVRMRFSAGGSLTNRQALLSAVDAAASSLNLYDAVTPDATISSLNITHYDYRREASAGVGLLIVDVWLTEVRVTTAPAFSSTQSPSAASASNNGVTQTQTPASAGVATPASGAIE